MDTGGLGASFWGIVLCTVGCLAETLAFSCQMPLDIAQCPYARVWMRVCTRVCVCVQIAHG